MDRLPKQYYRQKELKTATDLELELKQRFCPSCPIARWRFTAAARGNTLYCGCTWVGRQRSGYAIWMYPPDTKREAKHIVAEAPSLKDICPCKS